MGKNKGVRVGAGKAPGKPKGFKGGQAPNNAKQRAGVQKPAQKRAAKGAPGGGKTLATVLRGAPGGMKPGVAKPTPRPATPKGLHTLLLTQTTAAGGSRTWADYPSMPAALDAFIGRYEAELRKLNPGSAKLTYSVADLNTYIDSLFDVSLMVSDPATKQYAPKGKAFLKGQLMQKLTSAAGGR
mmetsp:Transcript_43788/g.115064  ORF Transcript_43788/g.115064 Transcript_43788/m.115064 type:complete len:184 (+) Transcript_43788:30-581(+)